MAFFDKNLNDLDNKVAKGEKKKENQESEGNKK